MEFAKQLFRKCFQKNHLEKAREYLLLAHQHAPDSFKLQLQEVCQLEGVEKAMIFFYFIFPDKRYSKSSRGLCMGNKLAL